MTVHELCSNPKPFILCCSIKPQLHNNYVFTTKQLQFARMEAIPVIFRQCNQLLCSKPYACSKEN